MDHPSIFGSPTFDRDSSIHLNTLSVGSASISPSGRDVVLASTQGLHVVDLDNPYNAPRYMAYHTHWEVADVQWSPFAARDYWVVSTAGTKALVWNLELSLRSPVQHTLHGHTRNICDINFSAHHPDVLATCALDTNVHTWDLRSPEYPVQTFSDWSEGARQVKWNRVDSNLLATSHSTRVRIWDKRKGAVAMCTMENAHKGAISGVDWSRTDSARLATCGFDGMIKFWNCQQYSDSPERIIRTNFPVRRARYAPFGNGLVVMPVYGKELHLFDIRKAEKTQVALASEERASGSQVMRKRSMASVKVQHANYKFSSHDGQLKEFLWRYRGDFEQSCDTREFQLISWGTDKELRLHTMNAEACNAVGYRRGMVVYVAPNLTRRGATYRSFRDILPDNASAPNQSPSGGMTVDSCRLRTAFRNSSQDYSAHGPGRDLSGGNPLNWMRGVKIGNREMNVFAARDSGVDVSVAGKFWDDAEALAEEIIYVGDKFKNVSFEAVDVAARRVVLSLQGPWGEERDSVHVRATFAFPLGYPWYTPSCKVEESPKISDKQYAQMMQEMQIIADKLAAKRNVCLEAVIKYLLGEWNEETSRKWFGEENKEGEARDESSSDDEDVGDGEFGALQRQDLEMSAAGLLGGLHSNANVPLPKACGAVWAADGRLVCFFPRKAEPEPKSLLQDLIDRDAVRHSKQRVFEGFGHLYASSSLREIDKAFVNVNDKDSDSDLSLSISSDSSRKSKQDSLQESRPEAYTALHGSNSQLHPFAPLSSFQAYYSNITTMENSSPALAALQYIAIKNDLYHFQPTKRELAEEYIVYGTPEAVCTHNADVCKKHGYGDLAYVWELCNLIVARTVPLEILPSSSRTEPVYIIARRAAVHIKRSGMSNDLTYDNPKAVSDPAAKGRVKWGGHPFGSAWLIPKLFGHFEALGDCQMLAILSCVFQEPPKNTQDIPKAMFMPAASPQYFPTAEAAKSVLHTAGGRGSDGDRPKRSGGRKFKWRLKNQERFSGFMSDGYADLPLLDPNKSALYIAYRETYAKQLRAWKLHKQAIEVLKYNEALRIPAQTTPFIKASKPELAPTTPQGEGLKIKRVEALEVLNCGYCGEAVVNELSVPCEECGHVTHIQCWKDWKGCGCRA